jgi:hypothetical protein
VTIHPGTAVLLGLALATSACAGDRARATTQHSSLAAHLEPPNDDPAESNDDEPEQVAELALSERTTRSSAALGQTDAEVDPAPDEFEPEIDPEIDPEPQIEPDPEPDPEPEPEPEPPRPRDSFAPIEIEAPTLPELEFVAPTSEPDDADPSEDEDDEDDDEDDDDDRKRKRKSKREIIEELTYEQHPGLPLAASKIFFSKKRWTISGFGEASYTHYLGDKNTSSGDIELYGTNLYRFVLYGALRATDWMILYAEFFGELYHDGLEEVDYEIFLEAFVDFVIAKPFNVRVGWSQVPIGYVNNNDEPVMYYSVNRAEVERLIIPSQWIDLGVQVYGWITPKLVWMAHAFQGVDGNELMGASWIRRGREMRFNFRSIGVAGKLEYRPLEDLEFSVSGLYMDSGNRETVTINDEEQLVRAPTGLVAAYARYEPKNWSLMVLGTLGWLGGTPGLYELTSRHEQGPQVLGARTWGVYAELGCDILHYFSRWRRGESRRNFLFHTDEFKLPLFVRYERLDTHNRIDPLLLPHVTNGATTFRSNLDVLTLGLNFNLRKNLVLKANYQFRHNRERSPDVPVEGDRLQVGLGFIF